MRYIIAFAFFIFAAIQAILPKSEYIPFGGAIRTDNGRWSIYQNDTHSPSNLLSVTQSDYSIKVWYRSPIRSIRTSAITPHRRLMLQHIVCGASVDTKYVEITCMKDGNVINPSSITELSYIWIYIDGVI